MLRLARALYDRRVPHAPARPLLDRRGAARSLLALALLPLLWTACGEQGPDPSGFVDPFMGTGAHGHVFPGATVPHGMVQLSPDNGQDGWDWVAGYHASDSVVVGFSHTHLSGTGIGDLADVLIMPGTGLPALEGPWSDRETRPFTDRYRHTDEMAEPGYYRVRLESGIGVELTASTRTGVHRYTFPDTADAALFLDLGYAVWTCRWSPIPGTGVPWSTGRHRWARNGQ